MRTTHCRRHHRWRKNRIVSARLVGVDRSSPHLEQGPDRYSTEANCPEVPRAQIARRLPPGSRRSALVGPPRLRFDSSPCRPWWPRPTFRRRRGRRSRIADLGTESPRRSPGGVIPRHHASRHASVLPVAYRTDSQPGDGNDHHGAHAHTGSRCIRRALWSEVPSSHGATFGTDTTAGWHRPRTHHEHLRPDGLHRLPPHGPGNRPLRCAGDELPFLRAAAVRIREQVAPDAPEVELTAALSRDAAGALAICVGRLRACSLTPTVR